ncbi:hypothetical protein QYF36_012661 [Acer negundo]|nr:hypothetical protein QYF36_012661 [Acer negundo]
MWALRRASDPLRSPGFSLGTARACCAKLGISSKCVEDKAGILQSPQLIPDRGLHLLRFYHRTHDSSDFSAGRCGFASQAGAESSGEEDDLEDGFSELEIPDSAEAAKGNIAEDEKEDGSSSEDDLSGDEMVDQLELSGSDTEASEKRSPTKRKFSDLFKAIVSSPHLPVHSVLDKWVKEGKGLSREEISSAMLNLRKRRMYGRALQLSEWLENSKRLDFDERDYASRLDLISKVRGLQKAEQYIQNIPKSFKGEVIYRTLLANCVMAVNVKKAEEVFNKMKDQKFPITTFAYNQLLLLYKRVDKKKIADVLELMEKENVKPSLFTYKILIGTKGQSNDITGMDEVVKEMKAAGIEPDISTQAILARYYVNGGLKEKAEAMLKEMEGGNLKENRWACRGLLPLYAELGQADEVRRVWKVCESSPRLEEFMAAIEAWGKLKDVEEAEAIFERMCSTWKKLTSKHYSALLRVYANNKMIAKGKDLVKRMADSGCRIGPLTWDLLVRLHVEAGEVEKAESILQKATQQSQLKPMFTSYIVIMEQYAKRGDIHNSEKMFHRMRQAGYVGRLRQFQCLVQAYIHAKAPAYGIRERMKADNIFPNKGLAAQLVHVDAFRKTAVSDLLD